MARNLPIRPPVSFEALQPAPADPPINPPASTRPTATAAVTATQLADSIALLTGNNSATVRRLGARQLLTLGSPEAIERLRQILGQPTDAAAVFAICEVLAQTGLPPPALLAPLVNLLGDTRAGMSDAVCRALTASQNGPVVSLVKTAARNQANTMEHRLAAIRCLGRLAHDKSAVAALFEQADDASRSIQAAVLVAISEAAQERFATLADAKAWWSENRTVSEAQWSRRNISALQRRYVAAVATQNEVTQRLAALIRADFLRTPDAERPKALLVLLKDELPAVRELALDLVNTWITDRKEIGVDIRGRLGELIDDPEPVIRRRAAKIVGDLRLSGEASRLAAAIERETDPEVRAALIDAAGRLDDRTFVEMLIPRLNDDSTTVVSATAGALSNLARRGFGRSDDVESVSTALAGRLSAAPKGDELRGRLLAAMSAVASESLRPIIVAELDASRTTATRCAALRAMSAYRDAKGAAEVRKWIDAEDALLRQAAVEALAGCGVGEPDLAALFTRLDPAVEPSAPVREQAWESYKAVAARIPASLLLASADRFASGESVADQERRIELLRIAALRADELGPGERLAVQERTGDARMAIGDFKSAAAAFGQAAESDDHATEASRSRLVLKALMARLRAAEDDAALEKLTGILNGSGDGAGETSRGAARHVLDEIRRRLDANDPTAAIRLIEKCAPLSARLGDDFASEVAQQRIEADALSNGTSDVELDSLLDAAATDSDAEQQLVSQKARALSRIHARLARPQTTSAATQPADLESVLIGLARRLAPEWRGFNAEATADERGQALSGLAAQVRAAARTASAPSPSTQSASTPPAP